MRSKERFKNIHEIYKLTGMQDYHLDVFGDEIAKREGYKDLEGMEAVHFYLIHKFNWLPSQVRAMSNDDIRFVLTEEMYSWKVPKEAIFSEDK